MSLRLMIIIIGAVALTLYAGIVNAQTMPKAKDVVQVNYVCKHKDTIKNFLESDKTEAAAIVRWSIQSGECFVFPQLQLFPAILKKKVGEGTGKNAEGGKAYYQIWTIETKPEYIGDYFVGLMRNDMQPEKTGQDI